MVKRIYNFVSVRQDLDVINQTAEQCLRHAHIEKEIVAVIQKETREGWLPDVQQAVGEATCRLSLAKHT